MDKPFSPQTAKREVRWVKNSTYRRYFEMTDLFSFAKKYIIEFKIVSFVIDIASGVNWVKIIVYLMNFRFLYVKTLPIFRVMLYLINGTCFRSRKLISYLESLYLVNWSIFIPNRDQIFEEKHFSLVILWYFATRKSSDMG